MAVSVFCIYFTPISVFKKKLVKDSSSNSLQNPGIFIILNKLYHFVICDTIDGFKKHNFQKEHILILRLLGKVTLRLGLLLRTPVVVDRYGLRTEEKRQGVRNGVRNDKIKKIHGVRNETCSGDRKEIGHEFGMANTGRS